MSDGTSIMDNMMEIKRLSDGILGPEKKPDAPKIRLAEWNWTGTPKIMSGTESSWCLVLLDDGNDEAGATHPTVGWWDMDDGWHLIDHIAPDCVAEVRGWRYLDKHDMGEDA